MFIQKIKPYFLNCFLLLVPIFIWNVLFARALPQGYQPEVFWKDIPALVANSENILRILVLVFPAFMKFSLKTKAQVAGFVVYLIGLVVYFSSWIVQMYLPDSTWSTSLWGFMAPAYTTIIWFVGIGLIGSKAFIKFPSSSLIYIFASFLFVVAHSLHAYIVFQGL